uniref:Uncharacterized protein n=1 Tax=Rhizochromulina marina TaxID=1034831 RepID=A0A7S2S489_9STRA
MRDVTVDTGGLTIMPGTQKEHPGFCDRAATPSMPDFVRVPEEDPLLSSRAGLVLAKAGDLILWDSRTIHCNMPAMSFLKPVAAAAAPEADLREYGQSSSSSPPPGGAEAAPPAAAPAEEAKTPVEGESALIRLVGYICMVPKTWASPEVLEMRQQLFKESTGTTHWPHELASFRRLVPDGMPLRSDPKTRTHLERSLIGWPMESKEQQQQQQQPAGTSGVGSWLSAMLRWS